MADDGSCECGCGGKTKLARQTHRGFGWVRGEPLRFIHGHNTRKIDYVVDPEHGCWIWQKHINKDGYGLTNDPTRGYKTIKAATLYYERAYGPVPAGKMLDHFRCDRRSCVNPDHVRPVTPRENTLRGDAPSAWNLAKTSCMHGHSFTIENTYLMRSGSRGCRACRAAAQRRYSKRRRMQR